MIFEDLFQIIKEKIKTLPDDSYVAAICKQGDDSVLKKIGEEAVEVIIAGKNNDKKRIIEEMADLYFMSLLVIAIKGISPDEVYQELGKRRK